MRVVSLFFGLFLLGITFGASADYRVKTVTRSGVDLSTACSDSILPVNQHLIGIQGATLQEAYDRLYAAASATAQCVYNGNTLTYNKQGKLTASTTPQVEYYRGVGSRIYLQINYESVEGCPVGQQLNPQTFKCEALPSCEVGTTGISTFDVAYRTNTNTSDGSSLMGDPQIPSTGCSGGCQVSVGTYSGGCWLKASVGPPYVVSCSFNTTTTGQVCSSTDESASAPLPLIACPTGTAPGEVNGVGGCYKTGSSSTTTSAPVTNPDGSTTTTKTTTNPDGSTTTTTTTTNADGSTSSSTTTTPAPIGSGTGGGSGIPGSGAGGTGDTDQAKFCQDNPKAALCQEKLKIDEEGTPEGKTDWTSEQDVLSTAINAIKDEVERGDWKQLDLGFRWDPPIPSGGCSAVQVFNYSIDICPALTRARELWGWVIYVLAGLAIWIRGVRALQGV